SALMAKMRIAPEDRPYVKLQCLRLLATCKLDPARMRLISGFIDTYLLTTGRRRKAGVRHRVGARTAGAAGGSDGNRDELDGRRIAARAPGRAPGGVAGR